MSKINFQPFCVKIPHKCFSAGDDQTEETHLDIQAQQEGDPLHQKYTFNGAFERRRWSPAHGAIEQASVYNY